MRKQEFCRCYSCDGILYRVRQGDTLYSISRRFEVALEDVMDANPFVNVYRLEPGMQICVPVPEMESDNWGEYENTAENRRESDDRRPVNGRGSFGGGKDSDERRSFNNERSEEDCPYGLCRDPMRFDGMGW